MGAWYRAGPLVGLGILCGCSQLPLDGPPVYEITGGASAVLSNPPNTVALEYALVEINPFNVECLINAETSSLLKAFGGKSGAPPVIRIGVGDVLEASIFESSAGGVFSPGGGANSRSGNFVTFPRQTVSSAGTISVPYAGVLEVAGKTPQQVAHEIEGKLVSRAIEPQVIVSVIEQNAASVTVIGDTTNNSNTLKLSGSGERILDMISKVGGLRYPAYEVFVTLQRKKRTAKVYFPTLVSNPDENIYVQPGDVISVTREQRKYVALGAVGAGISTQVTGANQTTFGAVGLFTFDQEKLSLNEAIGKAGGLLDDRADPAHVYIFRTEQRRTLEKMGVDLSRFAPDQPLIPTAYRANFRDPSGFLLAQKFPMRDKDAIYAGNSDSTEFSKLLIYTRLITSTAAGVAADANIVAYHGP